MGQLIQLDEAAAALDAGGRRGTGFAYCPEPDAATRRAYRRACNNTVYTAEVVLLAAIGLVGAAWIIGAGAWSIWLEASR